ncbi:MAG: hypothetical protein M3Q45_13030 [Chloroflexota bacterium]|nr:hypothetical protein [Chloroflexota bacterium]
MSNLPNDDKPARDADYWAQPVTTLQMAAMPAEAINLNVQGRQLTGPLRGFGQLWQKSYSVSLPGADVKPAEVIQVWKENFPKFWPAGNRFYAPLASIAPGEVVLLNLAAPGGMQLSTGIMVIYADDVSFSFMTPQGHMFAGMITFSAQTEDEVTVAQIQALIRAGDPLYELGCRVGIVHKLEDRFWQGTLWNLAAAFGVTGVVQQTTVCIDPRLQWAEVRNIWHNAAIRSGLYTPVRLLRRWWRR